MTPGRIRGRLRFWTILGSILLVAASAAAQEQEQPAPRGNRNAPPLTNAQVIAMLDAYAIVEAQTFLQLNDEQYGQFVARLKRLQDTRRRNMQLRHKMLQELRRLTAPAAAPDEAVLRERVQALRAFDEQAAQAMRREYDAVDEVLDVRQQARFRLLEERMELRRLDILMRARERARTAPQRRGEGTR